MAARVAAGQRIRVINTHGSQVVDTWAFSARDATEWMSMEASRAWFLRLAAAAGDTFVTNQRRPILTLVEDTSGGAHDTLIAPCDAPRYRLLGVEGHHDNCRDNLHAALAALLSGLVVVAFVLRRWTRRPPPTTVATPPIDDAMRERIRREIGER